MIAMLLANRTLAEILGGALLLVAFALWWSSHNHAEQKIGAQACIQATTEVKADAVRDNSDIEAAHAAQLGKVVAVYEQKLSDSAHANDGLAQRLRDDEVRESAVRHVATVAARVLSAASKPSEAVGTAASDDPFGITAATQEFIDACSADARELAALQAAWRSQVVGVPGPR